MNPLSRLGGQAVIYGLGYGFTRLLGFALLPLYTRHLTPAEYGVLALLTVTGQVAAILSQVGMGAAMFREVIYEETERGKVESTVVLFLCGVSACILALAWIVSPHISSVLFAGTEYTRLLRLTFAGAAFGFLESVLLARLRIEQRATLYATLAVVRFVLAAAITVWFLVGLKRGLAGLVEATTLVAALFALEYLAFLWPDLSLSFSTRVLRRLLRFGAPLVPASVAGMVTLSSDRYFLQHFAGPAQVGIYSLGYTVGLVMAFFVNSIQLAWPAQMFEIAKKPDAEATLSRLLTVYAAAMATLSLALALGARELVRLLSTPEYYAAAQIVPWVAASYVFLGASYIVNSGLSVRDKMKYSGAVNLIVALLNLLLNFWLVPRHGYVGAAWAALGSYLTLAVLMTAVNQRVWKIPYEYGKLAVLASVWIGAAWAGQWPVLAGRAGLAIRTALLLGYGLLAWGLCRTPRERPGPTTRG